MLMLVMSDLRVRNMELSQARAELAQMAVAEERERLRPRPARPPRPLPLRDHPQGRAGRTAARRRTDDAATEVAELEQVARTALGEVRDAVSGYRQPTLEGELAGARMALSAAGIEADVQQARVALDPAVEAVLAWAVRKAPPTSSATAALATARCGSRASLTDAGGRGDRRRPRRADAAPGGREPVALSVPSYAGVPQLRRRGAWRGAPRRHHGGPERRRRGEPRRRRHARPRGTAPAARQLRSALAGTGSPAWPSVRGLLNGRIEAGALAGGGYRLARHRPGPTRVIRVLLAEDQAMVRGALASLLDLEPDIEVVAQVSRGDEVVAAAAAGDARTSPCSTSRCPAAPASTPPTSCAGRCPTAGY